VSDRYGALQLVPPTGPFTPVANPPFTDEVVGDVLLAYLGSYLMTVLNGYGTTLWQEVMPMSQLVEQVFFHDPEKNGINTRDLPALFVFREDDDVATQVEWIADDYRSAIGMIHIIWVPPDDAVDKRRLRVAMGNAIKNIIDSCVEAGRDLSWQVAGDSDPQAQYYGSQLLEWCGAEWLDTPKSKWRKLNIGMLEGSPSKTYDAFAIDYSVRELLIRDITVYPENTSIDATFVAPDGGTGLGPFELGEEKYD
jgi:hypothetical protein